MASKPGQHMPAEHSGDDVQSLPALLSRYHSAISPSMLCAASSESKNKLHEELEEFIVATVRSQIAEMEVRMDARLVQMTEERYSAGLFHSQHSRHGVNFSGTASNASRSSVAKTRSMISLQAAAGESQSQGTPCSQKTKIEESTPSQFNFTHSTWDASMLVGIDAVGLWESFYLVLLMILTMVVVLIFCGIVLTKLTSPEYDDLAIGQLKAWRLNTAHMYAEADKITGVSLASRACALDKGLATSATQVDTIAKIRDYLPEGNSWHFSGPAMCMTALVIWYLTIIKELSQIARCFRGFMFLPTDHGHSRVLMSGEFMILSSTSKRRQLWVAISSLMRLVVVCILAYAGTLYIVYTIDVQALLEKCVALEVVLNFDELAFSSLTSSKLQAKINMMCPLMIQKRERRPSIFARMWGTVALCVVGVALYVVGTQVLVPYAESLRDVEEALCGGQKDFTVWVMDEVSVPIMSYTPQFHAEEASEHLGFSQRAIREAISDAPPSTLRQRFALVTEYEQFSVFKSFLKADSYPGPDMEPIADTALFTEGADAEAYLSRLHEVLNDTSGSTSCLDMKNSPLCYVYNATSAVVRYLCPVSCSCGSIYGGIRMHTNGYCPDGATDLVDDWTEHLPCDDNSFAMRSIEAVKNDYGALAASLSCEEIATTSPWRCKQTSVAAFCPVSCDCALRWHRFCPPSCSGA